MSYPDQRYYITFFSKRYKDFEKSINANQSKPKGSPKVYLDSLLIIFFAIMMMKGKSHFKAQHAFLCEHPCWVKKIKFKSIPVRTALSHRYKQLAPRIEQFVDYLGDLGVALDTDTPHRRQFKDYFLVGGLS